jgi:hypothetical protein
MSKTGVEAVAVLHRYFPKGAANLAKSLKKANLKNKILEEWREEQLIGFIEALKTNAHDLKGAYIKKRVATVAWVARNILELDIWIDYCNLSDVHAKRFQDDSVRDLLGLFSAVRAITVEEHGEEIPQLKEAQQILEKSAEAVFGVVDEKYLRVDKAADELGRRNAFVQINKMYSKLAHPTAWALKSGLWSAADQRVCDDLFACGAVMVAQTLLKVSDFITQKMNNRHSQNP